MENNKAQRVQAVPPIESGTSRKPAVPVSPSCALSPKEPVKSKALAMIEKQPPLVVQTRKAVPGVPSVSTPKTTGGALIPAQSSTPPPPPKYKSWEWEAPQNEKPVKILSYTGSLPNQFGNDGDFYVDEITNMLYGPKKNGVWPDTGVLATGLCKRTWIAFTRMRVPSKIPDRSLAVRLKALFRFLLPLRSLFRSGRQKLVS